MKRNFVIAPRDGDREREREKCKVFRGVLFILLRPVRKLFRFSVCNRFLYVTNRVPLSFLCTLYYFILDESDNWSVTWRIEAGTQAFVVWGEMKKCRVRFGEGGEQFARVHDRVPFSSVALLSQDPRTPRFVKNFVFFDSSGAIVPKIVG